MTTHRDQTPPPEAAATPSQSSDTAETLRDAAQAAGREAASKVQEAGQEIAHQAQRLSAQGQALASDYYQQGRKQALVWQEQLEQQIREKPIQSLLVAGGIGVLLGILLRR
jgi:ElaB/YqjD/DUF883 family membrane-anchored ribosome-binding protein